MNLRKQKHYVMARIGYNNAWFFINWDRADREMLAAQRHAEAMQALKEMVEPVVEEAKQEFVCIKVKDGTVVDTYDNLADAQALMEKHVRQKKAKLQVMDSSTGEFVLFEELAV